MLITLMLLVLFLFFSFFFCRADKMRCRSEKRVCLDARLLSDSKVYLIVCFLGGGRGREGPPLCSWFPPSPPPPPKMAGLWGTVVHVWPVSAYVVLSFIWGEKRKKERKKEKNQHFSHLAIRCFYGYVVQAAGPCERVRGGGPWEKRAAFG